MTDQILNGFLTWLRKYWLPLIFAVAALVLVVLNIGSCVDKRNYKREIRSNNNEIMALKKDMKAEAKKSADALKRALAAEADARKERAAKNRHKANVTRIRKEKEGLEERIAALPPTQIVTQTVYILEVAPEEVTLEPRGVLFTLVAARRNLEILNGFTLQKKEIGELQLALNKSEAADKKTQKANKELKKSNAAKDVQLVDWAKAEIKWKSNFTLSEKRGKKARNKGRKEGGIVGFLIGLAAGIFLDR